MEGQCSDDGPPCAAHIKKMREALESIAQMYERDASVGDLAMAMYEAACIAREALKGTE